MKAECLLSVSEDAEFLKMKTSEFIDWCAGRLIISIGKGEFRTEVNNVVRFAGDWRIYNTRTE